ncbi:hypothetical protein H7698_19935 [Pseudomonas sp. p50]|uniref:hypothetical protein n=1 Tax=Pseudomonas sp. p50(2008) TaxID=2816832 RepID=UPI00188A513A|nr:hypothetical protein [Pseudomonas sp. p50(2008)]MBF4558356.1 hypothetical protein [Pseudomonas sp. p50(2008)]
MYTSKSLTANQAAIAGRASSHSLIRVHPQRMVGYQAAIASKAAPTVDPGT